MPIGAQEGTMTINTGSSCTGGLADRRRTMPVLVDDDRGHLRLRRLRLAGGVSRARGREAFRSLAGNKVLVRVVGGYVLFTLAQYSVWVAMLVYAYWHGGAAVAGLVAVAQLVPAAVLAPIAAAVADRRSPVFLLAGGYLVQAAGMAATALAITGHARTGRRADPMADTRLATGAAPVNGETAG
jgi:hypothetical protein